MKVTVLMENTTPSGMLEARHGLSLFLESGDTRILFDVGPDEAFLTNSLALGVDVRTADAVVISHGHSDHGGGLHAYLGAPADAADPAPIYVNEHAFEEHAAGTPEKHHDIGLDPDLADNPRFVKVHGGLQLNERMRLFAGVAIEHPIVESNRVLLERTDEGFAPDSFRHEQSLLVEEGKRRILVSGCSHCGILNIMDAAERIAGTPIDVVVGGFHLMDPGSGKVESAEFTRELARELKKRPSRYFTFHCTGLDAYGILRDELGDRIGYLYAGCQVEL